MCSQITNNFSTITEFSGLKSMQGPLQEGKITSKIKIQLTHYGLMISSSDSKNPQIIDIKGVSKSVLGKSNNFSSNDLPYLQSFTKFCKQAVKEQVGVLYKLGITKNQDIAELEEFISNSEFYQKFLNSNPKERFELICRENLNKDDSKLSSDRNELLKKMRSECTYVNIDILERTRCVTGGRGLFRTSTPYNTGATHPLTLFPNASQIEDLSKDPIDTFKELCDSTYNNKNIHLIVLKGTYDNISEGYKWVKTGLSKNKITLIEK